MEFKIGDKVQVIAAQDGSYDKYIGEIGTIITKCKIYGLSKPWQYGYNVMFDSHFVEQTNQEIVHIRWYESSLKIINLESKLLNKDANTKPYCCPVCNGKMTVPNGFYNQVNGYWSSSSSTPERCRSCNGTGIVWVKNE